MALAQSKTTISQEPTNQKQDMMSQIKWLLNKFQNKWWEKSERKGRSFNLSHKDAIIAILVAICIVGWACVYWWKVMNKYTEINNRANELKNLPTYNISLNNSVLT